MVKRHKMLAIFCLAIFLTMSSLALAAISEEDIVAFWLLDDNEEDGSGNGFDATVTDGKWDKGQIGGGLEFNGASTFMEVLHSDEFNFADSLTLAAWARVDGLPAQHIGLPRKETEYVLHPTDAGGNGFNLRFYIGLGGAWAPPVISDTVVEYGEWHHLAGTYDGSELKVYIDGKLDKAQPQAGEITPTQNPLRWSNDCCGGRMLQGALDELIIFNRALDEAEIQQLMSGIIEALPVQPAGKLAALWGDIRSR